MCSQQCVYPPWCVFTEPLPPPCPSTLELLVITGQVVVRYTPVFIPSRLVQLEWPGGPLIEFNLPPSNTPISPAITGTYTLKVIGCRITAVLDV
jgi:hypothetical protein